MNQLADRILASVYDGVVMLHKPPIDKVAALVMMERICRKKLEIVGFWDNPKCSAKQMLEWENQNVFPIDIGDEKYHENLLNVGSATEYVVKWFGRELLSAEQELVAMINKNNNTGNLKGFHQAISWTMRELYELDDDPKYHREVIRRAADAVHVFLEAKTIPSRDVTQIWDELESVVPDVVLKTKRQREGLPFVVIVEDPLTPGRYLRDLHQLGFSFDEIRDRVMFWVAGWEKIQEAMVEAEKKAEELESKVVRLGNLDLTLIMLEAGDKFLIKAASRQCDVLLARNPSGHTVVMAAKFDLSTFALRVKEAEPEKWHHRNNQPGLVLNGGVIYSGVDPSSLSFKELLDLLQEKPPKKVNKQKIRRGRWRK